MHLLGILTCFLLSWLRSANDALVPIYCSVGDLLVSCLSVVSGRPIAFNLRVLFKVIGVDFALGFSLAALLPERAWVRLAWS